MVGSCQVMDNQPVLFWKTIQYVSLIQLFLLTEHRPAPNKKIQVRKHLTKGEERRELVKAVISSAGMLYNMDFVVLLLSLLL